MDAGLSLTEDKNLVLYLLTIKAEYFLLYSSWNPWSLLCAPKVKKELALEHVGNKSPMLKGSVQLQTEGIVYLTHFLPHHNIYIKWEQIKEISWSHFQHVCSGTTSLPLFYCQVVESLSNFLEILFFLTIQNVLCTIKQFAQNFGILTITKDRVNDGVVLVNNEYFKIEIINNKPISHF